MSVTVATVGDDTNNDRVAVAGNGKVPSASPTGMFSLDSRFRGNDGAVVVDDTATDNNRAAVASTVATVGGGVDDGAVATRDAYMRPLRPSFNGNDGVNNRAVAVGDGHVRPVDLGALLPDDATIATGNGENKIVIPAGHGNPVARIARQIGVGSGTADVGGDSVTIARRRRCR